jgi:predicted nuclease with TOPRIM domain
MDDKLGRELIQKEEELQRLRNEVQTYVRKIRGYQTLEHLLQESKQECADFKRMNDELARKLDNFISKQSPMVENGGSHVGVTVSKELLSTSDSTKLDAFGKELKDIAEHGGKSAASESSTARSSPSFVRINSGGSLEDDPWSTTSGVLNGGFGDHSHAQQYQGDIVGQPMAGSRPPTGVDDAAATLTRCISLEVDQLAEQLRKGFGSQDLTAVRDVSSDLIRTGIAVRQLEEQSQAQKVEIVRMSAMMDELKQQCEAKQQTIDELQKRCSELQDDVQNLQAARDNAMKEARTKYIENAVDTSEGQSIGAISAEWVAVEKQAPTVASSTSTQGDDGAGEVTAMSTVEMELRKRIEKLNASICELVTVNRSWDEHCRKLEFDHSQRMSALNGDLHNARRRLEEIQRADEQRQAEFDQLLLNSKKRCEMEEMAKEEALGQLHLEKRSRAELEERCIELTNKTSELESRVRDLQLSRQVAVTSSLRNSGQVVLPQVVTLDRDLELQILREQVAVFKEDFDHERQDREAARASNEVLHTQLNQIALQLETVQQKLYNTVEELKQSQKENADLRKRFQKVADDVKVAQSQVRPEPVATTGAAMRYMSTTGSSSYVTAPTPVPIQPSQPAQYFYPAMNHQSVSHQHARVTFNTEYWPCRRCTFLNDEDRPACKMCGYARIEPQLQPRGGSANYVYNDGFDRVAGLPGISPTLSSRGPHAGWRAGLNSSLETDQSQRPSSL